MADFFDPFDANKGNNQASFFDPFAVSSPSSSNQKKQNKGIAGDLVTDFKRGVEQLPGIATGLLDIPVAAVTGKPYVGQAADALGGITGFAPAKWAKDAEAEYSPGRQESRRAIDQAWEEGGAGNIAKAYIQNPQQLVGSVVESIPSMVGGAKAGQLATKIAGIASPALAAAGGEGAVMAGQQMDQLSQTDANPRAAAASAALTGIAGGAIGAVGGKVAQRLGVIDPDVAIAGGAMRGVSEEVADKTIKGAIKEGAKRVAGGAISEGVFEELPQSVIEQMASNVAQGKPFDEGVARSAIEGAMAGGLMGGAFNVMPPRQQRKNDSAQDQPKDESTALALPAPVRDGTPSEELLRADVDRQNSVDSATANAEAIYRARAEYEAAQQQLNSITLVTDPAPLQQRIDALLGIDVDKLKGLRRANYERDLKAMLDEQVGITHDEYGLEQPLSMGDYIEAQNQARDKQAMLDAAERSSPSGDAAINRMQQLADEEAMQQPDIPVVGTLSKAANLAVRSGAHAETIRQQAAANTPAQMDQTKGQVNVQEQAVSRRAEPAPVAPAGLVAGSQLVQPQTSPVRQDAVPPNPPVQATDARPAQVTSPAIERKPAKPVEQWTAEELQARIDRGNLTEASMQKLRGLLDQRVHEQAGKQRAAKPQGIGITVGNTAINAEPVTVRNGVIHVGESPLIDYETEREVSVPEGASKQQIADAIKASGQLGKRKVFGVTPMPQTVGKVSKAEVVPAQSAQQSDQGADHGQGQKTEVLTNAVADTKTSATGNKPGVNIEAPTVSQQKTNAAQKAKQDKVPAITPQHVENGKEESATASVVEQSLKKGADNSSLDLRQERDLLLKKVDQAIAAAPTAEEKDAWDRVNKKIDLKNNMHVDKTIGYRVFDVPGDGKFKVLNLKEALQRFRDRVEANPGFRKPVNEKPRTVPEWQKTGRGGTESTVKDLLDDGEYSAAVEYGKLIGKPLIFGQYQDGSAITIYTDAKPFEREGYDDFNMVSVRAHGAADKTAWAVIDLNSGLTVSSGHPTRVKAIAETNKSLAKTTPGQMATAVRSVKANTPGIVGTQDELEQRWLTNVEQREAEAQGKVDQEHRRTMRSAKNGLLAETSVGKDQKKNESSSLDDDIAKGVKNANDPARQAKVMADIEAKVYSTVSAEDKQYNEVSIELGGGQISAKLDKPLIETTKESLISQIKQQKLDGWKEVNLRLFTAKHGEAIKAAMDDGQAVPDEVLADYPGLIRDDLNDDQRDQMADDLVGIEGAARTRAIRAWAPKEKLASDKLTGNRRDPLKVNIFNPYEDGDIVTINGKDWQIRNDGGWYLTSTGNWRGEHPTIKKIAAMNDLIAMIENDVSAKNLENNFGINNSEDAEKNPDNKVSIEQAASIEPDYSVQVEPITGGDTIRSKAQEARIADFGEKIGGARKDTSKPLGPRAKIERNADDRPAWARKYVAMQIQKIPGRINQSNIGKWQMMEKVSSGSRSGMVKALSSKVFDSEADAIAALPHLVVAKKHRVYEFTPRHGGEKQWGIFRNITDKKRALVRGGFQSYEEAMQYIADNPAEIIEHKFGYPERPWLDRIERIGTNRLKGDVSTQMFADTFGFRGGEFGNWNMGGDGQAALNHAYEALLDLADAIGIPPRALSLDGRLAIAFGARGTGGKGSAAAHYEPGSMVINLTKIKGAGSLAHEWWHAVDHYFASNSGRKESYSVVASGYSSVRNEARQELIDAIKNVVDSMMYSTTSQKTDASLIRDRAQKRINESVRSLDYYNNDLRSYLTNGEYNRGKKVATKEQLAQWDAFVERLKRGDMGASVYIENQSKMRGAMGFTTGEVIRDMNAIYKSVTGRSFMRQDPQSRGRQMHWQAESIKDNTARLSVKDDVTASVRGRSSYYVEAKNIDNQHTSDYWSSPEEMGARAFESYIFDKISDSGNRSDYLVHGVENRFYSALDMYPYPEGEERKRINDAFDKLFSAIQTKETDKGVALYNIADDGETAADRINAEVARWSKIVGDYLNKSLDRSKTHVFLGSTPASMQALGLPDMQVRTGPHMMDYANVRLTRQQMNDLPRELANPKAVYIHEGDNGLSINFVTSIERNGEHLVVALKPNQNIRSLTNAHFVATVINPKTDRIVAEFRKGNGLYVENKDVLTGLRGAVDMAQQKNGHQAMKVREHMSRTHGLASLTKRLVYKSDLVNLIKSGHAQFSSALAGNMSASDKAIYGMAAEGKSSAEILKFIASASRNPFYRQLARLLMKTGINPSVTVGDGKGWKMNAGEGNKYAAAYNPETNTVALFKPGAAERNMLHELMHAATIKALAKNGLASAQMKALFSHVKKSGGLNGMYGMSDIDEFIAEAFTNPKFQDALKKVSAPKGNGTLSSAWHWFVRIVRGILGIPQGQENALSKALEIGLDVMREDMKLRNEQSASAGSDAGSIRYNVAGDDGWSVSEPSKMDEVIYALQDKQIDLKRVMQSIMKTGKQIKDNFNAYLQEELFHGRAAKGVKDFLDFELRPLLAEMNSSGVDMGDFEEYLWNRHAEERNKQIAKINPDMKDGGSGISTADARAYLAGLSADQRSKYESLASRIDAINRNSQAILVSSGLETQETIDAWNGAYQHYVPLQREDVDSGHVGTGKGFSVRGNSSKRAMGSGKQVVDIIANIAMQRERNIVRSEKNRVSNALFGLAVQNPNADFWKVDEAPKERVVENKAIYTVRDEHGNETEFTRMDEAERFARSLPSSEIEQDWQDRVTERIVPGFSSRDNVVHTRINGEDHYITFNERDERAMRMAMALKNLDVDNLGRVLSVAGKATRYLASINTQYNPVFGVINLIRDVQGSLLNLSSTPLAGEQKRVLGYTLDAIRGIYTDIRDHRSGKKPSSKWAELFEEFQKEGGQTGYRDQYANAEDRSEAIRAELSQFKEGKAKHLVRGVFGWLSDYNETMENAVRLASYKAAKEKGMSNQQAASLAKNITVNFNRKGQMATQVGALYAFFNASVQGTARIAQTLFEQDGGSAKSIRLSKTGKKILMGGIMLGSMQALLLAAAGYDDDEPPEFVRDRNLILPIGDGKYFSLAMPLGFHVIPGIGRVATEFILSGGKDPAKRAASFLSMFAEAFNPVGSSGWSLQTITPSVVDPFAALAENKDFTGREIYRENFSSLNPKPGHARAKDVATVWSRYISEALNSMTGGSEFKPGVVSPSPDAIDYLISQVTGGVGREANKVAQTIGATSSGEDLPLYKVPLVGRFIGDTQGQSGQSQKFYDAIKQVNMHEAEYKGLVKSGRREEANQYRVENPAVNLIMAGNYAENQIRKLRDAKRELIKSDASQNQVRAIDDRISETMRAFNERAAAVI